MKVIALSWRDPLGNLKSEQFEADKYRVGTEASWLKLLSKEEGHIVRLIPAERVQLVEFGELPDPPRIIKPGDALADQLLREEA